MQLVCDVPVQFQPPNEISEVLQLVVMKYRSCMPHFAPPTSVIRLKPKILLVSRMVSSVNRAPLKNNKTQGRDSVNLNRCATH